MTRHNYPVSDPVERKLRDKWYETQGTPEHKKVDRELSAYIFNRAKKAVEEDRKKHPRAKRNQVASTPSGNRVLP